MPSDNWEHSDGESVSEFLGININILCDGVFQFYQTGLIWKVLEITGMQDCNDFPRINKFEEPIGIGENGLEDKIYWKIYYVYVIGMILYLKLNTIPDI